MPRPKVTDNPVSPEGCYIRYKLDLKGIRLEDVAKKAHRSISLVSKTINQERWSENVEMALAHLLGFPSWQHLWADAFINAERRAG